MGRSEGHGAARICSGAIRMLAGLLVCANVALGCGGRDLTTQVDASSSANDADAGEAAVRVSCGAQTCDPDQYCFHSWMCGGVPDSVCNGGCPCFCDVLPASCPPPRPCTGQCGYFYLPGMVDHQVYCFGS
jgi:hypothetical protein